MKIDIKPKNIDLELIEGSTFEKLRLNFVSIVNSELERRGLNRSWLAYKLKISAPVVTKLLSGKSNPTLKTISEICDILKIDIAMVVQPRESDNLKLDSCSSRVDTINIEID